MAAPLLEGLRVVTTALNLPGPVACARLRDLGAAVAKVEPPSGDPLAAYCPAWHRRLHEGVAVHRLDLKGAGARAAMDALLAGADLLVTAQRRGALERMGLAPAALAARHPRLCHVAITGHAPPHEDVPGHDLTYLATQGLLAPPAMPPTLFADMAGAERAVAMALALVVARDRTGRGAMATVALEEAARSLAQPRREGLTTGGAILGGALAGYNVYAAQGGFIAVAALEDHFARRLAKALDLPSLTIEALRERFASRTPAAWEAWAREHDLPLVAVRDHSMEGVP
jgi:crotonobetainyl-CoA:carnitine CoA-transferase CaiB-like acyl-CoA transferase